MDDTIFALSSGAGRAAIAVVRLSGPAVRGVLAGLCGAVPKPRFARLATLRDKDGLVLDQALVLFFPGPASETGEDIGELQLHGSRAVVRAVLAELGTMPGLRPAHPGEFARRALANGKMDLLDVESLADLIDAETDLQRNQAFSGGGNALRKAAESWRDILVGIRAELEAGIDFSDEGDVADHLDSQAEQSIERLLRDMRAALVGARRGEIVRRGFRIVLAGATNAGKSSLLNAIARRDVAIVSPMAGTTRDRIEVHLDIDGMPVVLVDTAGFRDSEDRIEVEGIRRAREAVDAADLTLWLSPFDSPSFPMPGMGENVRRIGTKCDLGIQGGCWAEVSVVTGAGLEALFDLIGREVEQRIGGETALLTRERHVVAVRHAVAFVEAARLAREPEVCAEELRQSERRLEELLGRIDVEDVLGEIFSRFCVGK